MEPALNTTAGSQELKTLRWRDVNLLDRTMTIEHSKTKAGERLIPLNRDALDVLVRMRKRAEKIGPI